NDWVRSRSVTPAKRVGSWIGPPARTTSLNASTRVARSTASDVAGSASFVLVPASKRAHRNWVKESDWADSSAANAAGWRKSAIRNDVQTFAVGGVTPVM